MQDPERSLGEIAAESGFADQSHMNHILKRLVHETISALFTG
jgi:AraC-like DNA-binding protein